MGLSPRDVDRLSFWELMACQAAFAKAHGIDKQGAPSDEAFFAAVERSAGR